MFVCISITKMCTKSKVTHSQASYRVFMSVFTKANNEWHNWQLIHDTCEGVKPNNARVESILSRSIYVELGWHNIVARNNIV